MLNLRAREKLPASNIGVYVKVCKKYHLFDFNNLSLSESTVPSNRQIRVFFPQNASLFHMHSEHSYNSISYNEASLSKIKQRSRRILAVALFVRICKQWNYPFPARIHPDDIQPVANLPAGKHSRFYGHVRIHLYKINKFEKVFFASVWRSYETTSLYPSSIRKKNLCVIFTF